MSSKKVLQPILKRHLAHLRRQHTILGEVIAALEGVPELSPEAQLAQEVLTELPQLSERQKAQILQDKLGRTKGMEACRSLLRRIREKAK